MSITYQTFAKLLLEPSNSSKASPVAVTYSTNTNTVKIQCGTQSILMDKRQLQTLSFHIDDVLDDLSE
jgi:hypothetical protein